MHDGTRAGRTRKRALLSSTYLSRDAPPPRNVSAPRRCIYNRSNEGQHREKYIDGKRVFARAHSRAHAARGGVFRSRARGDVERRGACWGSSLRSVMRRVRVRLGDLSSRRHEREREREREYFMRDDGFFFCFLRCDASSLWWTRGGDKINDRECRY